MRRGARALVVGVGLVGVGLAGLAGCGGGRSAAEAARQEQVGEIRAAAQAGDTERAHDELEELRRLVDGQLADGAIDEGEAARVLAAADGVEAALGPPPTEATTTTTTTAPPPPPDHKDEEGDDKDDDDNKGKGKGKDDD